MADDFTGKVVIVTGSSSGIGEDAVIAFARAGAHVVVTGRNAERVAAVAKLANNQSPPGLLALEVVADVSNDDDAKRIIETTVEKFGQLDVLVNNAGIIKRAQIADANVVDALDQVYQTNVRALVLITNLAVPHLLKTKGNVVNVSSVASTRASAGNLPYNISKAAVDIATKGMANELSPQGVRVNAINPAMVDTPIFSTTGAPEEVIDAYKIAAANVYPVRRIGHVSDTSRAILYLASDKSSFITGVTLPVDGGYLSSTVSILPVTPAKTN